MVANCGILLPIWTYLLLLAADVTLGHSSGELYAAADQLADWQTIRQEVRGELERIINDQTERLIHLNSLYASFIASTYGDAQPNSTSRKSALNPVHTFVQLRHIVSVADELEEVGLNLNHEESEAHQLDQPDTGKSSRIPTRVDYEACGQALIRLQALYKLTISQVVRGHLIWWSQPPEPEKDAPRLMQCRDCLELGKFALKAEVYSLAVGWFEEALDAYENEALNDQTTKLDILEHLAFATYKNKQLNYALNVTRLWFQEDPTNERAIYNMEFYQEELEYEAQWNTSEEGELLDQEDIFKPINISSYRVENDQLMGSLCRRHLPVVYHHLSCYTLKLTAGGFQASLMNTKVETLSASPRIIRVHEFLSEQEASTLRRLAMPILERSTITYKGGLVHSEYRIAKTAWLSPEDNEIVERIQHRISSLLQLNLQDAEPLQVVNYGIGGFYGPHLDCGRLTEHEQLELNQSDDFSLKNERLVTVLMYLSGVEAGGGTVFTRLNLTVLPVERSAVIWYNQHPSGYSDSRTLHLACPILLGTKWIATEWIREISNIFAPRSDLLAS